MTITDTKPRELAHRNTNGLEVSLFWTKVGNVLTVEVYDTMNDEFFSLEVPSDRAMDAYRHPFAYLAAAEAREGFDKLLAA